MRSARSAFLVVERGTAARRRVAEAFAGPPRDARVTVTLVDAGSLTHDEVTPRSARPATP